MKYKVKNEIFDSSIEAVNYCDEEDISLEEIEEVEEENLSVIEENPAENPIEESVITTDREIAEARELEKEVGAYMKGDLYEVEEKQLISKLAGAETGHRKDFPEMPKTSNIFEVRYKDALAKLRDPESLACPVCGLTWERITSEIKRENLSQVDVTKKYESSFPIIRALHVQAEHPAIAKLVNGLFQGEEEVNEESVTGNLMPNQTGAPNPEQCNDKKKLSKEELAEAIQADPETRRRFYLQAFRKLSKRD